jgi:PAS domain S-box-containing protein
MDYQRPQFPRYLPPRIDNRASEAVQTVQTDEVSNALNALNFEKTDLNSRLLEKILLENSDDVVHVLSLKGLFLYASPSSKKVLEYDPHELVGVALSAVCHPSDIVPVTRDLKDTSSGAPISIVFRIRRKITGYTWFECHGTLHVEQGKGRKHIILIGRERPVYVLSRNDLDAAGGVGEGEVWSKMSTAGLLLFVSSTSKSTLDRAPEDLIGTSIQALMRPDSRADLSKAMELARTGKRATVRHEIQHRRGQFLQASTTMYPGDAHEGQKPTFLITQTRLLNRPRKSLAAAKGVAANTTEQSVTASPSSVWSGTGMGSGSSTTAFRTAPPDDFPSIVSSSGVHGLSFGTQDTALASPENVFDELKTTRSSSWQYELRQMQKTNKLLLEELNQLNNAKKKRKRRQAKGLEKKICRQCRATDTPEWRRGPSGDRDLCNSCGLKWAKQVSIDSRSSNSVSTNVGGIEPKTELEEDDSTV